MNKLIKSAGVGVGVEATPAAPVDRSVAERGGGHANGRRISSNEVFRFDENKPLATHFPMDSTPLAAHSTVYAWYTNRCDPFKTRLYVRVSES